MMESGGAVIPSEGRERSNWASPNAYTLPSVLAIQSPRPSGVVANPVTGMVVGWPVSHVLRRRSTAEPSTEGNEP